MGGGDGATSLRKLAIENAISGVNTGFETIAERRQKKNQHHVGFAVNDDENHEKNTAISTPAHFAAPRDSADPEKATATTDIEPSSAPLPQSFTTHASVPNTATGAPPLTPSIQVYAPQETNKDGEEADHVSSIKPASIDADAHPTPYPYLRSEPATAALSPAPSHGFQRYTTYLRTQPAKSFRQTLKPWNGRLRHDNWLKVAIRPFILFAYPTILWSALVYSLSIGWLIVLSESVSSIYANQDSYHFKPLSIGLVYISPFIGGVLGTAVAGKVSDVIVRFMSRRNGGVYEPEFRLVMAIPVLISTVIGLMGFGWSADERDRWIVPTVFFGIISFGCALGSTTAITFAVDSYRQYAGEALVTLNFSKSESFPYRGRFLELLLTMDLGRYLPRPDLLALLQPLAGS